MKFTDSRTSINNNIFTQPIFKNFINAPSLFDNILQQKYLFKKKKGDVKHRLGSNNSDYYAYSLVYSASITSSSELFEEPPACCWLFSAPPCACCSSC